MEFAYISSHFPVSSPSPSDAGAISSSDHTTKFFCVCRKLTENDRNRQRDDTLLLGCLLAELSLTPVFHAQSTKLPLLERAIFLRKAVLTAHPPR